MTEEEKLKATIAEQGARIAELEAAGANGGKAEHGDVRARAVAEAEERDAMTPVPTQAELDRGKLGGVDAETGKAGTYKTRQSRA